MHNLFGDTDSVDVILDDQGGYQLKHAIQGDTIADVLDYVNFDPEEIRERLLKQVAASTLNRKDKQLFQKELVESLQAYTYLMPEAD